MCNDESGRGGEVERKVETPLLSWPIVVVVTKHGTNKRAASFPFLDQVRPFLLFDIPQQHGRLGRRVRQLAQPWVVA